MSEGLVRVRLAISKQEAMDTVDGLIQRTDDLLQRKDAVSDEAAAREFSREMSRWRDYVKAALLEVFDSPAPAEEFIAATAFPRSGAVVSSPEHPYVPPGWDVQHRTRGRLIENGYNKLLSIFERLDVMRDPETKSERKDGSTTSRLVFVVHGRDEGLRENVARVLERLGFEPIILSDQPNEGRTLIEKLEANALDVGFAVVILSPDDYARGPDEAEFPAEPNRARQNVVMELGYFMGRLGRDRVCPLYTSGTETPSDIHGLAYIPLDDSGAWRYKLAAELAAAGYEVDLNLLR